MKKIIWVTSFAMAMGFLETAIVIYLRALFYPEGFDFPLKSMPGYLILTELSREAATIIMLAGIAWIAGSNRHNRFAWFIYTFAIWDIFYYVFLKLILNWPVSWLTWDVLFLIPCIWAGPVLAPVILSFLMIVIWFLILKFDRTGYLSLKKSDYLWFIAGAIIHIANFCWDNLVYMLNAKAEAELHTLHLSYVPHYFNWWVFVLGCIPIFISIFEILDRNHKLKSRMEAAQMF